MKLAYFKPLIFSVCLIAYASSAFAIGLLEAYQSALQNDTILRASMFEKEAGAQYKVIGRSNLLPNISASYGINRINSEIDTVSNNQPLNIQRHYNSDVAVLQMKQPIFNADSWARYQMGNLQTDLSNVEFDVERQSFIKRFFETYAQANYAQALLTLAEAERDAYELQEIANENMLRLGEGTKTDYLESHAKYQFSQAKLIESQYALQDSYRALSNIVGRQIDAIDGLSEQFSPIDIDDDYAAWEQKARIKNPEIIAKKTEVALAKQEIKKQFAGHLPNLDLVANVSNSSSETVATFNQDILNKSIGLQLNIPIYAGGRVDATSLQAQAQYQKAQVELETITQTVLLDLRTQFNYVATSALTIDALNESLASATALIDATEKSLKAGVRTNQDILNAQKQFFQIKRDLTKEKFNHLLAYINLKKAAGYLNDQDMAKLAVYF